MALKAVAFQPTALYGILKMINIEIKGRVVLIRLNRPKALNALSNDMLEHLLAILEPLDTNPDIGCFLITGDERAFAAGADIKEMQTKSYMDMLHSDYFARWEQFSKLRTPKIAAVRGFALGGGCELAMMCDLIYAAQDSHFAQPEIELGVMPGIGGTQRLTRLVGKSKAMEMILTGKRITADEAERIGLVSQVFTDEQLLEKSLDVAHQIANFSKSAVVFAKEAINHAEDMSLAEGLRFERRLFHMLFATDNQKEGMNAFIEKREASFSHL